MRFKVVGGPETGHNVAHVGKTHKEVKNCRFGSPHPLTVSTRLKNASAGAKSIIFSSKIIAFRVLYFTYYNKSQYSIISISNILISEQLEHPQIGK
jgi:hypothetical protein